MKTKSWLKISLFNLLIVASLGLLMRYKIAFEFPFLEQKYIQFAHYHFAFYGWISHTLMVLMVHCLEKANFKFKNNRYQPIFISNLLSSYGMLVSFLFLGYGIVSVLLALASILATYYFSVLFVKDLRRSTVNFASAKWFRGALFFNFLSTLGIFALGYMMLSGEMHQNEYLATTYYFLHFQYNGWFFFACMGLLADFIDVSGPVHVRIFRLFAVSCIPAYFLSVLWLKIPGWLYVVVVLSAFFQVYGLILFLNFLIKTKPRRLFIQPATMQYILLFVGVALTVKILLQLGSTIPSVSKLAFGFRPVVIAYLHLVLLAVISLFLLFVIHASKIFLAGKAVLWSLFIFSTGVLLNEIVLAIQGVAAFSYTVIPYVNEALFAVAIILAGGIGALVYFTFKKRRRDVDEMAVEPAVKRESVNF